jgi:hypothetical protein
MTKTRSISYLTTSVLPFAVTDLVPITNRSLLQLPLFAG